LAVGAYDGRVSLFDPDSRRLVGSLDASRPASDVAFSRDGRLLTSIDQEGAARLWDVRSGRELPASSAGSASPHSDVSPDGTLVARPTLDGTIGLWRRPGPVGAAVPVAPAGPSAR